MWNLEIGFDRPAYLWLLSLVPIVWLFSYRTLASLGTFRRVSALLLRTLVMALVIFALAELQLQRVNDRVTVIYLLDQSASIPRAKRELMRDYVIREVHRHRRDARRDAAGVIVFGRDAVIEIPPYDDDVPDTGSFESWLPRQDATSLAAALKLAQASFPEGTARRVVIVTDGNENLGSATQVAPTLAANGIGIDVVPVRLATRAEVAVEKVTLPADIRRGAPFHVRAVLNNYMEKAPAGSATVRGKLRITRSVGNDEQLVGEQEVELPPGKTVIGFKHEIDKPAMYTYTATFAPDDKTDDLMPQNNRASAFTYVRGKGRILLIEDRDHRGEFDFLVERLRAKGLELDVHSSDQAFSSLAELQGYDCVILANVPRGSGGDTASIPSFRAQQIEMLVRNTEQMGAGLIMLGGPNSFGAGGWANTELEKAMPVDFQIKNAKIRAVGALVLTMHASEMARGNYWQKVIARNAIKTLGPMDYCGIIHWSNFGANAWLWGGSRGLVRIGSQRNTMLALLSRMTPGDMPDFDSSMKMALAAFNRVNAATKHMIIISDGDPSPPSASLLARFRSAGIKVTTVAVATHGPAGSTPLRSVATATGGNYYVVTNPKVLPEIYQREARRVSRPVVKDLDNVAPQVVYPHEILEGIDNTLPPLKGMVLTTVKPSPLVEVAIRSPVPSAPRNSTILAAWTYGLGRTVAFTTDAGHRWATAWTQWENYDKFFSQMVRWAMRPPRGPGKYSVAADVRDGKVRVAITALDADDQFRNMLQMAGAAVGPDLKPFAFPIHQEAPGRYIGQFKVDRSGSYHLTVVPGPGEPPILTGVNVPYSAEFRDHETNYGLLRKLVSLHPEGGQPGQMAPADLAAAKLDRLLTLDTFRQDLAVAPTIRDVWPWLLWAAACLFLLDVFVRRVAIDFHWVPLVWQSVMTRWFGGQAEQAVEQQLDRLRDRKAEVARSLDRRNADARFEPEMDADSLPPVAPRTTVDGTQDALPSRDRGVEKDDVTDDDEGSYTARLLEAKKKARKRNERL